jgi:HdeA/HdeB family
VQAPTQNARENSVANDRITVIKAKHDYRSEHEEHDMRLNRILPGLVLALLAPPAGQAQITIDIAKITCKQLPLLKVNPDYIALWLSGYYNAKRDNTVVDVQRFKDFAAKVKRDCLYGNQGTVMETVERLIGSAK